MSFTPERIGSPDQLLLDSNTGAVVGIRSGRTGADMLPALINYLNGVAVGIKDTFGNTLNVGGVPITITASATPAIAGTVLTATLGTGYSITNVQWVRDTGSGPVAIAGATSLTYQLKTADITPFGVQPLYQVYPTGTLSHISSAPFLVPNSSVMAPGAPTVSATAANASAVVTIAPGTGDDPTGYTVTSSPSGGIDANAGNTTSPRLITGLANGTAYTFTSTATNTAGTSTASAPSNSITPSASVAASQSRAANSFAANSVAV